MADVCCLCGDVGFSDKLFRCSRCRHRFQHSYCSNNYREYGGLVQVCDWCECEGRNSSPGSNSGHAIANELARSAYSGERVKKHEGGASSSSAEKAAGKSSSPRPTIRRYKLLKDVMC